MSRIAITGGTGFVGTHVARALLDAGHSVKLVARGRRRVGPRPRGVEVERGVDIVTGEHLLEALRGAEVVVHLAAVINERGGNTFDNVNRKGAEHVALALGPAGVQHVVHVSAIGVDPDPGYPYFASKWQGEQAIRGSGVPHTVLRPSLLFGPGDGFFTRLATMVRYNPVVPVAGNGGAMFQPFAVRDLARVIVEAVERGPSNRVYEVGGPEHMSYDDIVRTIAGALGVRRRLAHIPVSVMMPAAWMMSKLLFWNPPVTPGQLRMLEKQNTTQIDAVPRDWGFAPRSFATHCGYLAIH